MKAKAAKRETKMEAKTKKRIIIAASAAVILAVSGIIIAYFIDKDNAKNKAAVGYNEIELTEEGFSGTYAQNLSNKTYSVNKPAEITNTGDIPVYVRARIELSDSTLSDVVKFSYDGDEANAKLLSAYAPDGWTKNADGYYYYNSELAVDDTATLLNKVFVDYGSDRTVTPYDIIIYTETVQIIDPDTGELFATKQAAFESIEANLPDADDRPMTIVYDPGTASGDLSYEQITEGTHTVKTPTALEFESSDEFAGWLMNGTTVVQPDETIDYNAYKGKVVTLKAQWGAKWLVNFMDGTSQAQLAGGIANPVEFMKTTTKDSYTVTMPEAIKNNYTFIRWFTDIGLTSFNNYNKDDEETLSNLTFDADDKNTNLYAQWGGTVKTVYNDGVNSDVEIIQPNGSLTYTFPNNCNSTNTSGARFTDLWGIVNKGTAEQNVYKSGQTITYNLDGNTEIKALWTNAKSNDDYANTTFATGSNNNGVWIRQNENVYDANNNTGYLYNYGTGVRSVSTSFESVGGASGKIIYSKGTFKWGTGGNNDDTTTIYFGTAANQNNSAFYITIANQKITINGTDCGNVSGNRLNPCSYTVEFWLDTTTKEVNWKVVNGDSTYEGSSTASSTTINGIYTSLARAKAYGLSDFIITEI